MSAQIIPFPKLAVENEGMFSGDDAVPVPVPNTPRKATSGLHLVKPAVAGQLRDSSQHIALRIVSDVCSEHKLLHPMTDHSEAFWATLPMPPARVETPLTVVRRLAQLLTASGELA